MKQGSKNREQRPDRRESDPAAMLAIVLWLLFLAEIAAAAYVRHAVHIWGAAR